MAAAVERYYCYQCANQTQVDPTEMPDEPAQVPRGRDRPDASGPRLQQRAQHAEAPRGMFGFAPGPVPPSNQGAGLFSSPQPGSSQPGVLPAAQLNASLPPGAMPVIQGQVTITQQIPMEGIQQQQQQFRRQQPQNFMGPQQPPPLQQQPMNMMPGMMQFMPGHMHPQMTQMQQQQMPPLQPQQQGQWGPRFVMAGPFNPNQGQMMPQMMQQNMNPGQAQAVGHQPGVQIDGVFVGVDEDGNVQGEVGTGARPVESTQVVMQNMAHLVGGNFDNLMQMLAGNIGDVVTAIFSQMGGQGGPPPITQEDVDRIPTNPVTKEMIAENRSCSICLENFSNAEPYKELSCNHQFHGSCIDRWLLIHGNCPICRAHFGPQHEGNGDQANPADGGEFMPHFHGNFVFNQPPNPYQQVGHQHQQQHQHPAPPPNFSFRPQNHAQPHQQRPQRGFFPAPAQQAPRTFVFAQPGAQQRMPQQQPHVHFHAHPGGAVQFPGGQQGGNDAFMWSGQVVLDTPNGPTVVLDLQQPPGHHHHHHHHPHASQQQAQPQARRMHRAVRMPQGGVRIFEQMGSSQGTRRTGRRSGAAPNNASARAPASGPQVPPQQQQQNFFQNIMNSVSQALSRHPAPGPANQPAPSTTPAPQQSNPSAATGTFGATSAGEGAGSSGTVAPANPPKLQEETDYD